MIITVSIIALLLVLDQLTKYLAEVFVSINQVKDVIPNFLSVTKIYNTGAAWGMFGNNTLFLAILSLVAGLVLGYFCIKLNWKKRKWFSITLVLIFSGCVGNMFDRFAAVIPGLKEGRPGVVDMIVLKPLDVIANWITHSDFPVFNLADAYLVVGVIMAFIYVMFIQEREKKHATSN